MIGNLTGLYIALFVLLVCTVAMSIVNALLLSTFLMRFGTATITIHHLILAITGFSMRPKNSVNRVGNETKILDITGMTRDQAIEAFMNFWSLDHSDAEFYVAIELGEIEGDMIFIGEGESIYQLNAKLTEE